MQQKWRTEKDHDLHVYQVITYQSSPTTKSIPLESNAKLKDTHLIKYLNISDKNPRFLKTILCIHVPFVLFSFERKSLQIDSLSF